MDFLVVVLAVFGFMGALRLAGRSLLRLLTRGAETFITSEVRQTHERRGDITALQASDEAYATARRKRFQATALFAGSVALLAVPPFTPWTALLYACYLPLWFLRPRLRVGG
jgi:hypothetical protein